MKRRDIPTAPIDWRNEHELAAWLVKVVAAIETLLLFGLHFRADQHREVNPVERLKRYAAASGVIDALFVRVKPLLAKGGADVYPHPIHAMLGLAVAEARAGAEVAWEAEQVKLPPEQRRTLEQAEREEDQASAARFRVIRGEEGVRRDREDIRRALLDARVASDDIDGLVTDMLRPLRRRELGPALHAGNYREARGKLVSSIGFLMRLASSDGGERGDPSGNGGSPAH